MNPLAGDSIKIYAQIQKSRYPSGYLLFCKDGTPYSKMRHGPFIRSVHDPPDPDAPVQQDLADEDLEHIHAHADAVQRQDGQAGEAA